MTRTDGPWIRRHARVVVADSDSVKIRTTSLGVLPFTGSPLPHALPLAAITMLGAGFALLLASRRRRRTGGTNV